MAPPQHPETTLVQLRAIFVPEVSQAMGSIWEIMWRKVQNFRHKRCKPCWEHLFVHMNTTSVPITHQSPQQVLLGSFSDCSCLWGEQDRCLGSRYCDQVLPKSSLSVRGRQRLCCSPNIVSGSWVSLAWCLKCPQWHRSCKMEPGLAVAAMATRLGRPPFPAAVCAWWYQAAGDQCMLQEKAGSPHWLANSVQAAGTLEILSCLLFCPWTEGATYLLLRTWLESLKQKQQFPRPELQETINACLFLKSTEAIKQWSTSTSAWKTLT